MLRLKLVCKVSQQDLDQNPGIEYMRKRLREAGIDPHEHQYPGIFTAHYVVEQNVWEFVWTNAAGEGL